MDIGIINVWPGLGSNSNGMPPLEFFDPHLTKELKYPCLMPLGHRQDVVFTDASVKVRFHDQALPSSQEHIGDFQHDMVTGFSHLAVPNQPLIFRYQIEEHLLVVVL